MKSVWVLLLPLLFVGCAGTTTSYLTYQTKPSPNTYNFYSNGIPITSYNNNQKFILFTAEETSLFDDAYIRVWLLVENNSDSSFVLEPYNIVELTAYVVKSHYSEDNGKYTRITETDTLKLKPQSPSIILNTIDAEKNTSMILTSIGGALKALSVKGTTIKDNNDNEYRINDKEEKSERIVQQTNIELNNTENWYNMFEKSFNAGVLRVNTLFPKKSINGYIYFHLPSDINGSSSNSISSANIRDCQFFIKLKLNDRTKVFELSSYKVW